MNNKIKRKNYRTRPKMSKYEKEELNKVLNERNYKKEDIDMGESIYETMEKAKQGIYDEIFMPNIISFAYQIGCCSKCVIKHIKELRQKDVNIHFIEENLDTKNKENDLLIGTLVGQAVYQMALEKAQKEDKKK